MNRFAAEVAALNGAAWTVSRYTAYVAPGITVGGQARDDAMAALFAAAEPIANRRGVPRLRVAHQALRRANTLRRL